MNVRVVTPDKLVYEGEAQRVSARAIDGDLAIMKNHAPIMTPLGVGELKILGTDGKTLYFAIDSGIMEVAKNQVNILSRDAVMADEIDVAQIQMDLEQEERKKQNAQTREEELRQDMEIHKLLNQLKVGNRK
jgi:F-type H+-transporting ATPase subunit epsilon